MRAFFPHKLYNQRQFCRRCQQVTDHGIYAREMYTTLGGMEANIPLLCTCSECQTIFVAFSNEFVFCRPEQVNQDYSKVFGVNRIIPGNWLYFKGSQKPCVVKSVFHAPDKDVVNVVYDNGPVQTVECPKVEIQQEESPGGYRLLPAQSAHTLIGDHIYHTIRDQFGVAVGLVWDGEKDKLAVLLKDGILVLITLPDAVQNMPNDKMLEMVRGKLAQVFPQDVGNITLDSSRGIVFLNGFTKNLSIKRAMVACINSLPKVRGCVDFVKIQPEDYATDAQIERFVLTQLEQPSSRLFDYHVTVRAGKVEVDARCAEKYYSKDLENKLAELPGVMDLNCRIERIPDDAMENDLLCKQIEADLALHSMLQDTCIKVSFSQKKFLLEGFVHTTFQKQLASLSVMKRAVTTAVENRLRQI